MSTMAEPVFELREASLERADLRIGPCSLEVRAGECVALTGPSGSGKSTLLALAAGVEAAHSGRVLWSGVDVTGASESTLAQLRRGRIGVMGQEHALLDHLPLWRGVSIGDVLRGEGAVAMRARAIRALAVLGLSESAADRRPARLSGGERQRAALARALLVGGVGLILDEPTSNLDLSSAKRVIEAVEAARARGVAVLLATHDERLLELAQRRVPLELAAGAR